MYKVGIIGCGDIAEQHAAAYVANGATIVALADVNRVATEKFAAKYEGAKAFDDYKALLDSGLVDVISICTPPSTHEEIAVSALSKGIHVLCEKPLANTIEEGLRIAEAARASKAKFTIGFRHRFFPAVRKVKELIDSGKIGPVVFIDNNFTGSAVHFKDRWFSRKAIAGGGTMMDTTSHSIDIFRYLVGEIAESHGVVHRNWAETDVEDASVLVVKSESGVLGTLTASWTAGVGFAKIDVIGQSGRILFDYHRGGEVQYKERGEDEFTEVPVEPSSGFPEEIGAFLKSLNSTESESPTIEDGVRSLEIIQNVYKASGL